MDTTQSNNELEMESFVNDSSEKCFETNQIWEELFPELKTMLMSELDNLINKIGEVGYKKDTFILP